MTVEDPYHYTSDRSLPEPATNIRARYQRPCSSIAPYRPNYIVGDTLLIVFTIAALFPLLLRIERLKTTFGISKGYILCNYMSATTQVAMMVVWWIDFQPPSQTLHCILDRTLRGWDAYAALSRGLGVIGSWVSATILLYVYLGCPSELPSQCYTTLPTVDIREQPKDRTDPSEARCITGDRQSVLQTERSPLLQEGRAPLAPSSSPQNQSVSPAQVHFSHSKNHKGWLKVFAVGWTIFCIGLILISGLAHDKIVTFTVGYLLTLIILTGFVLQLCTIKVLTTNKDHSVLSPRAMFLQALAHVWLAIRLIEEFDSQPESAVHTIWYYLWRDETDWLRRLATVLGQQYYNLLPYIVNMCSSICIIILILKYLWLKGIDEDHHGRWFLVKYS